jgi:hypothetical protein
MTFGSTDKCPKGQKTQEIILITLNIHELLVKVTIKGWTNEKELCIQNHRRDGLGGTGLSVISPSTLVTWEAKAEL